MTILGALRDVRASLENPALPLTSATLVDWLAGPPAHSGVTVSETSSLTMPAVWRSVNLIAGTNASLPLHAYRTSDDVRLPVTSGQASDLLANPHPDLTPFELWEQEYAHLLLWGNGYLRKLRDQTGVLRELWPLYPSRVRAGRATDGTKVYLVDGNTDDPLTDKEILHIPGFGYDGVCGVSPVRLAKEGIGLALAAEQYGARLFGNGSLASGILQTDQRLTKEDADRLKATWETKAKGIANAHKAVVLDSGAKFQQLTIPPEDAQFLESRKFQVNEIARIFGVPSHMLMDTDRSTSWGTGIEQMSIGFVVYTLRPWLTRVEQRLTRLLNPQAVYARYSVEGLLRGDTAARYASYAVGRQWGWLSVNDIRRHEDMPPVENGNTYLEPLNMVPIGTTPTQPEPTGEPIDA